MVRMRSSSFSSGRARGPSAAVGGIGKLVEEGLAARWQVVTGRLRSAGRSPPPGLEQQDEPGYPACATLS